MKASGRGAYASGVQMRVQCKEFFGVVFLAVEIIVPLWFRQAVAETVLAWRVGTM